MVLPLMAAGLGIGAAYKGIQSYRQGQRRDRANEAMGAIEQQLGIGPFESQRMMDEQVDPEIGKGFMDALQGVQADHDPVKMREKMKVAEYLGVKKMLELGLDQETVLPRIQQWVQMGETYARQAEKLWGATEGRSDVVTRTADEELRPGETELMSDAGQRLVQMRPITGEEGYAADLGVGMGDMSEEEVARLSLHQRRQELADPALTSSPEAQRRQAEYADRIKWKPLQSYDRENIDLSDPETREKLQQATLMQEMDYRTSDGYAFGNITGALGGMEEEIAGQTFMEGSEAMRAAKTLNASPDRNPNYEWTVEPTANNMFRLTMKPAPKDKEKSEKWTEGEKAFHSRMEKSLDGMVEGYQQFNDPLIMEEMMIQHGPEGAEEKRLQAAQAISDQIKDMYGDNPEQGRRMMATVGRQMGGWPEGMGRWSDTTPEQEGMAQLMIQQIDDPGQLMMPGQGQMGMTAPEPMAPAGPSQAPNQMQQESQMVQQAASVYPWVSEAIPKLQQDSSERAVAAVKRIAELMRMQEADRTFNEEDMRQLLTQEFPEFFTWNWQQEGQGGQFNLSSIMPSQPTGPSPVPQPQSQPAPQQGPSQTPQATMGRNEQLLMQMRQQGRL